MQHICITGNVPHCAENIYGVFRSKKIATRNKLTIFWMPANSGIGTIVRILHIIHFGKQFFMRMENKTTLFITAWQQQHSKDTVGKAFESLQKVILNFKKQQIGQVIRLITGHCNLWKPHHKIETFTDDYVCKRKDYSQRRFSQKSTINTT